MVFLIPKDITSSSTSCCFQTHLYPSPKVSRNCFFASSEQEFNILCKLIPESEVAASSHCSLHLLTSQTPAEVGSGRRFCLRHHQSSLRVTQLWGEGNHNILRLLPSRSMRRVWWSLLGCVPVLREDPRIERCSLLPSWSISKAERLQGLGES